MNTLNGSHVKVASRIWTALSKADRILNQMDDLKLRTTRLAYMALLLAISTCSSRAVDYNTIKPSSQRIPISVNDLNTTHRLVGPLGEPAGNILCLSLVVNDEKHKGPRNSVTVISVNGRKLKSPAILNVYASPQGDIKTLVPGERMTVLAYEEAMMTAIPYQAMEETVIVQCADWSNFGTWLVLLEKSEVSNSKTNQAAAIGKRIPIDAESLYTTYKLTGPIGEPVGELTTISITAEEVLEKPDMRSSPPRSAFVKVNAVNGRELNPPVTMSATIWSWGNIEKLTPGEKMTVRAYQNAGFIRTSDQILEEYKSDKAEVPIRLEASLVLVRDVNAP